LNPGCCTYFYGKIYIVIFSRVGLQHPVSTSTRPAAAINTYWLLALAGLLVLLASTYHRAIHTDDAWIGEFVYWANHDGYVRSELFRGLLHSEVYQEVYHKLFVWHSVPVVQVFGWSVYALKSISLAYLLGVMGLSWYYLKNHFPVANRPQATSLYFALLLTSSLAIEYSFIFRPETMLMFLGFSSWLLLRRALLAGSVAAAAGAGVFAGLAALTHLNGLIFIMAGGLLLLWRRRWLGAVVFGGLAAVIFAGYGLDMVRHHSWELFREQMFMHPAIDNGSHGLGGRILYLLNEHQRFFHSPKEIVLSLLLLLAAYVLYRRRPHVPELRNLALYLILLVLSLDLIVQGKTSKYLLLYMPYMLLLIVAAFDQLSLVPGPRLHLLARGLLGLYLVVNIGYSAVIFFDHRGDQQAQNAQLGQRLKPYWGTRIIAPVNFIFPNIEHFQIQGATYYFMQADERQQQGKPFDLFASAASEHIPLIILDPEALEALHLPTPSLAGQAFGAYHFAFQDADHYVYTLGPPGSTAHPLSFSLSPGTPRKHPSL
jgi:hypothetical protein